MRIIGILLVIWLIIGLFAGLQRQYYTGAVRSCAIGLYRSGHDRGWAAELRWG